MNWEALKNTRKTRQNARATPRRVSIRLASKTRAKRKPCAKARDVRLRKTITKGMRLYFLTWYKTLEHSPYARDIFFSACRELKMTARIRRNLNTQNKETNNG